MKYRIDELHSDIEFKIKHLMISKVRGKFTSFRAGMDSVEEDFSDAKIWCDIEVSSIDTSVSERDAHLRSSDFFDVEKYPYMRFRSSKLIKVSEGEYLLKGSMEIKGISNPIELRCSYNGSDVDNYGVKKFGFEIEGEIERSRWDLNFNVAGGASTLLIGEKVMLDISIQVVEDEK